MEEQDIGEPKGYRLIRTNYTWRHVIYDHKVIRIAREVEREIVSQKDYAWMCNEALKYQITTAQLLAACMKRWQQGRQLP